MKRLRAHLIARGALFLLGVAALIMTIFRPIAVVLCPELFNDTVDYLVMRLGQIEDEDL